MNKLTIQSNAEKMMSDHAVKDFPDECCGFLYGHETGEIRVIELVIPAENKKEGDKKRRFEISAIDYMKAEQYALKNKIDLLGIYHSHPQHPAIASEHDLIQAMPFFSYIILSVLDGKIDDIKSWTLNEDNSQFMEEKILNTNS